MKKFLFILLMLIFSYQNITLADEVKDEMYYKRQIQNQIF